MKNKYFYAESREAAEKMAEAFFGCNKDGITLETTGDFDSAAPTLVLAMVGTPEEMRNSNGSYQLYYEAEGLYLELYPVRGAGTELESMELTRHLSRKNITSLDTSTVQNLIASRRGRGKIAPAQKEYIYGENIKIDISKDEMQATATLLKPEPGGAMLEFEAAKKIITDTGVPFGLNEQTLKSFLEKKDYGVPVVIAETELAQDGEDGKLIFHFSTDERTGKPREIGGGRVDLRTLDLFVPIAEGTLLITKIPATEGTPGSTVTGKLLKAKPGKDVNLPKGKNIDVNAEKTEMRAKCSGMVEFINNSVNVSSVYKVDGDCDISVGNIEFDGSVHVSGNVRSGNTIKASGGIVVGGTVEAATLIAGGNVEVKGGMQGADKGRIEAGGSVTIMFIERGTVITDGSISTDVSIHSVLEAGGSITAIGRRGAIIGGRAGAAGNVITNCVGAVSRANTEIEVGVMPRKRVRLKYLEKEIERLKNEVVKLDQLDTYLANSKDKMDPETWNKLHRSGVENRLINEHNVEDYNFEIDGLKYELEHATDSRVHVYDTVFEGTRIIIGNGVYKVNEEIKYATFKYKDAEVIYGPCDLSRQP